MRKKSHKLKLTLTNIPTINLRAEFNFHHSLLHNKVFLNAARRPTAPIDIKYMIWYGMPDDLLTLFLIRATIGLESYLPYAVRTASQCAGQGFSKYDKFLENPFSLSGDTADAYYNRLPGLVNENFSLKRMNGKLWKWTNAFYKEIRNPLLHGYMLEASEIDVLSIVFDNLCSIYGWIDQWSPPDRLGKSVAFKHSHEIIW
jgi:hypothetical protein